MLAEHSEVAPDPLTRFECAAMTIFHIRSSICCPREFRIMPGGGKNYDHGMPVDEAVFLAYFSPEGSRCETCKQPVDLWDCIQETLSGWSLPDGSRTRDPLMFTAN